MGQKEMILEYMKKHGSVTVCQAERPPIRCRRLAEMIRRLKVDGYSIVTTMIYVDDKDRRYGYAKYSLVKDPGAVLGGGISQ